MKKIIIVLCLGFMILPALAQASQATNEVRVAIDEVIGILKAPQYQDKAKKEEQKEELWKVIRKVFDFRKISDLSLANYRKKFTDEQMTKFSDLFADLLSDTYLKRVQEEFKNEEVKYLDEVIHPNDKSRVLVKTLIHRENVEIPVDYSMWLNNGVWRVYDIKVEGVSLVKNYRTQFQDILLKKSPVQLIEQLEKKKIKDTN